MSTSNLAILGCGNIGSAIAKGLAKSGLTPADITLTRRKLESLSELVFHRCAELWQATFH